MKYCSSEYYLDLNISGAQGKNRFVYTEGLLQFHLQIKYSLYEYHHSSQYTIAPSYAALERENI